VTSGDAVEGDSLLKEITSLIERTTLIEIRLVHYEGHLEIDLVRPTDSVKVHGEPPRYRSDTESIGCRFRHRVELRGGDNDSAHATVEIEHLITFALESGPPPSEDAISEWIDRNVFFMLYPYLRESVQSMTLRLGLDPVVLGVLERHAEGPKEVSILRRSAANLKDR
jgi:hypothetical protein